MQEAKFLKVMDAFLAHWADVNTATAPDVLLLAGAFSRADLQVERAAISNLLTAAIQAQNEVESLFFERSRQKGILLNRMKEFNAVVRGRFSDAWPATALFPLPLAGASAAKWIVAMRDIVVLWSEVNANPPAGFVPPLVLSGGYSQAQFAAETAALGQLFQEITTARHALSSARIAVREQCAAVRQKLAFYRFAVNGRLGFDVPLSQTIPKLTSS
jgi:hypothetical protein